MYTLKKGVMVLAVVFIMLLSGFYILVGLAAGIIDGV